MDEEREVVSQAFASVFQGSLVPGAVRGPGGVQGATRAQGAPAVGPTARACLVSRAVASPIAATAGFTERCWGGQRRDQGSGRHGPGRPFRTLAARQATEALHHIRQKGRIELPEVRPGELIAVKRERDREDGRAVV